MTANRRPFVGVMGAGDVPHTDKAAPLGRWLAEIGVNLVTGGGGGVMASVSQAFVNVAGRRGVSIGILPGTATGDPTTYPNDYVEIPIRTHLTLLGIHGAEELSRNHINVLTSDVIIALAGWYGTASEVQLAVQYRKPIIAYIDARGEIPGLQDLPDVPSTGSLEDVQAFVVAHLNLTI